MKVVIVTPYFRSLHAPKGGVGSHYAELAAALSPLVEKVTVIVPHASFPSHISTGYLPHNVELVRVHCGNGSGVLGKILGRFFNFSFNMRVAWKLFRLQRAGCVDIVETTNYQYPCLFYSFVPGHAPIVTRVSTTTRQIREANGLAPDAGLGLIARLERLMIRRSTGIVTHTRLHAGHTSMELGLPISRFHLIPHGIFVPQVCPPLPPGDPITVLFVGALDRRKGADVLIESIPVLLARSRNLAFRIVGYDKAGEYEKMLSANLPDGMHMRVTFLGAVSQDALEQEYRNCHLVVCPSRYESFGLVFAEAGSFGRVPVGTTAGGIPEVVEHGVDGILVEPGSAPALIEALERLVNDREAIHRLASAARRSTERKFDRALMAQRTLEHYRCFVAPHHDEPLLRAS